MSANILAGGFDLAFIDIDVRPFDAESSTLIRDLPPFGSHHVNTIIKFIPGGNGFNLCRTLASLGRSTIYVGPINSHYESLVKSLKLPLAVKAIPNSNVNYTCILNFKDGEIQFNSIRNFLSPSNLTPELVNIYRTSVLKPISNIALNKFSIEWISSLILSLIDEENELIYSPTATIEEKLKFIENGTFEGLMFIDPCDISHFERKKELKELLVTIAMLEGEKFLSVNEVEFATLLDLFNASADTLYEQLPIPIIYHSAEKIVFYSRNTKLSFRSEKVSKPVTFVGAGDCFNGGFIHSYLNGENIEEAIHSAIKAATTLISTGKYPTTIEL